MTARKANPISPPNPTGKGLTPGRLNRLAKHNRDFVDNLTDALEVLGGLRQNVGPVAKYFVDLGKKSPTALASVVARAMPLQIKAEAQNIQFIVQQLVVDATPVPGVLASPVKEHVFKLPTLPLAEVIEDDDA